MNFSKLHDCSDFHVVNARGRVLSEPLFKVSNAFSLTEKGQDVILSPKTQVVPLNTAPKDRRKFCYVF